MAAELVSWGEARRSFDLDVRAILAQWQVEQAAAETRQRMVTTVRLQQIQQLGVRDRGWLEFFGF